MSFKEKLKKMVIDNLLVMVISFVAMMGSAYMMAEQILPNLKSILFLVFLVSFVIFMYNIIALMNLKHIGKRFINDIKDLSDGKIDGKQFDKDLD